MTQKVNVRKLKQSLPTLLTPSGLSLWDQGVARERNDYHQFKFRKNNPSIEQEKFSKIISAFEEYKEAQELFWKTGNDRKKSSSSF